MTTQTDGRRVAFSSPPGMRSVLRNEATSCFGPAAISSASSGGEPFGCGPEAAHPPTPAAALYREELGWPVVVSGMSTLLRCGERVDVVSMPSGLGGQVNHSLKLLSLDAAVLEIEGRPRRWAFFCQSQPPSITNLGLLHLYGVTHHSTDSLFLLPPSPACNGTGLRWVCPPAPGVTALPMLATISMSARVAVLR